MLETMIENQFSDMKKVGYRLHSAFIHRGQATFGHYWIYIRDFKNKVYRMYNDQTITEVSESEVLGTGEETTATPYFLVFIREDLTNEMVDSVVRDVWEPEEEVIATSSGAPSDRSDGLPDLKPDSTLSQASTAVPSSEPNTDAIMASAPSSGSLPEEPELLMEDLIEDPVVESSAPTPAPFSYAQIAAGSASQRDSPTPSKTD